MNDNVKFTTDFGEPSSGSYIDLECRKMTPDALSVEPTPENAGGGFAGVDSVGDVDSVEQNNELVADDGQATDEGSAPENKEAKNTERYYLTGKIEGKSFWGETRDEYALNYLAGEELFCIRGIKLSGGDEIKVIGVTDRGKNWYGCVRTEGVNLVNSYGNAVIVKDGFYDVFLDNSGEVFIERSEEIEVSDQKAEVVSEITVDENSAGKEQICSTEIFDSNAEVDEKKTTENEPDVFLGEDVKEYPDEEDYAEDVVDDRKLENMYDSVWGNDPVDEPTEDDINDIGEDEPIEFEDDISLDEDQDDDGIIQTSLFDEQSAETQEQAAGEEYIENAPDNEETIEEDVIEEGEPISDDEEIVEAEEVLPDEESVIEEDEPLPYVEEVLETGEILPDEEIFIEEDKPIPDDEEIVEAEEVLPEDEEALEEDDNFDDDKNDEDINENIVFKVSEDDENDKDQMPEADVYDEREQMIDEPIEPEITGDETQDNKEDNKTEEEIRKEQLRRKYMVIDDGNVNIAKIMVIGVGGAGNNAVNRMIDAGVNTAHFVAINTDKQALLLSHCDPEDRYQIGSVETKGLGAGSDPTIGEKAAEESKELIEQIVDGVDLLFIAAGMGGGTGTGAAPVVAKIAKEKGCVTVAVVTKPFMFEGRRRELNAKKGIENLEKYVDTMIIIPNDKLMEAMRPDTPFVDALRFADDTLRQGICGIADLIATPSLINLDFADVRTTLKDQGLAHMGIGAAKGENRIVEAVKGAVSSPLLETTIEGASSIILNVTGGRDLTLTQVNEAARYIREIVDGDANVIFGMNINEDLREEVIITLIATGFNKAGDVAEENAKAYNDLFSVDKGAPRQEEPSGDNRQAVEERSANEGWAPSRSYTGAGFRSGGEERPQTDYHARNAYNGASSYDDDDDMDDDIPEKKPMNIPNFVKNLFGGKKK